MSPQLPVLLLHGANGTGASMRLLADAIGRPATTFLPDLLGHGGRTVPQRLSVAAMADDVLAFMDAQRLETAVVGGYSFGGSLALYLARHWPERFSGVFVLAAKLTYDVETVRRWSMLANPGRISGTRAEQLAQRHAPQDWRAVLAAVQELFNELKDAAPLGEDDLRSMNVPALVLSGLQDPLVSARETERLGALMRGSRVSMFPGPAHPLEVVPLLVPQIIRDWVEELEASARATSAIAAAAR